MGVKYNVDCIVLVVDSYDVVNVYSAIHGFNLVNAFLQ